MVGEKCVALPQGRAQPRRGRRGREKGASRGPLSFSSWWDLLLWLTGDSSLSYLGAESLFPGALGSLCSHYLWSSSLGVGGAGCEDTLSLVMEQGPVLSPSPSPAQPSILT